MPEPVYRVREPERIYKQEPERRTYMPEPVHRVREPERELPPDVIERLRKEHKEKQREMAK